MITNLFITVKLTAKKKLISKGINAIVSPVITMILTLIDISISEGIDVILI